MRATTSIDASRCRCSAAACPLMALSGYCNAHVQTCCVRLPIPSVRALLPGAGMPNIQRDCSHLMVDLNDYPLLIVFAVGLGVVLKLSEIGWQLGARAPGFITNNQQPMMDMAATIAAFPELK